MAEKKVQLIVCWLCLMLIYLLGDVLRVYEKGQGAAVVDGKPMDQRMFLLAALMMLVPIMMALVTAFAPDGIVKWTGIAASVLLLGINAAGIHTYASLYDRLLILVSLAVNLLTIAAAWTWQLPA